MIEVEREIFYLEDVNVFSIRMSSVDVYGIHYPKRLYVTAIFDKNLEKAKKKAWDAFYEEIEAQDKKDRMYEGKKVETIRVDCGRCSCHK